MATPRPLPIDSAAYQGYDLQSFEKDITSAMIDQAKIDVEKLTESAEKEGLLSSGKSTEAPNPGRGSTSPPTQGRDSKIMDLVSGVIQNIKSDRELGQKFLSLLDGVGLHSLVGRIRQRSREKQMSPQSPVGLQPATSVHGVSYMQTTLDSGISGSASNTPDNFRHRQQQSLLPSPAPACTIDVQRQRSHTWSSNGSETKISPQLFVMSAPILNECGVTYPVQESDDAKKSTVIVTTESSLTIPGVDPEDRRNVFLEKQQAEAQTEAFQEQTQRLRKGKTNLQNLLKEKDREIENLKLEKKEAEKRNGEEIESLRSKVSEDEKELERYKSRTAELEQQLEKNNKDLERQLKEQRDTASKDLKAMQVEHKKEIEKLEKELSEQKALEKEQTAKIKTLECELLQKELNKVIEINKYEERVRNVERERDHIHVKLLQKEKEDETRSRKEVEIRHRESLVKIAALEREVSKSSNTSCTSCTCTCL